MKAGIPPHLQLRTELEEYQKLLCTHLGVLACVFHSAACSEITVGARGMGALPGNSHRGPIRLRNKIDLLMLINKVNQITQYSQISKVKTRCILSRPHSFPYTCQSLPTKKTNLPEHNYTGDSSEESKLRGVTQTRFSYLYDTFTVRNSTQTSLNQVIHTDNGKKGYSVTAFKDAVTSNTEHK